MKKSLTILLLAAGTLVLLPSCSSFTSAQGAADYNGDGLISDAEYKQFHAQRNVEDRNVYSERTKRANIRDTFRDAEVITGTTRNIKNILNNF